MKTCLVMCHQTERSSNNEHDRSRAKNAQPKRGRHWCGCLRRIQLPHTPEVIIEPSEMLAYFANETTRLSLKVVNADSRFSYAFATFQNGSDQIHRSRETLNFDELLEDFKANIHEYIDNGYRLPPTRGY